MTDWKLSMMVSPDLMAKEGKKMAKK